LSRKYWRKTIAKIVTLDHLRTLNRTSTAVVRKSANGRIGEKTRRMKTCQCRRRSGGQTGSESLAAATTQKKSGYKSDASAYGRFSRPVCSQAVEMKLSLALLLIAALVSAAFVDVAEGQRTRARPARPAAAAARDRFYKFLTSAVNFPDTFSSPNFLDKFPPTETEHTLIY
jgi:hypothetical protein